MLEEKSPKLFPRVDAKCEFAQTDAYLIPEQAVVGAAYDKRTANGVHFICSTVCGLRSPISTPEGPEYPPARVTTDQSRVIFCSIADGKK